jgi:uncharacterized protein with GYD domain
MATYVLLTRWTQQGIENIRESPARFDALKGLVRELGGEVKAYYLVTGQYDGITIIEAPDDETMAKIALAAAAKGNVRTETLRAFPEEEYRKIVTALP